VTATQPPAPSDSRDVPRYPLVPEKLLDTASRLARDGARGRPAYADHRRAVSTAYYAVFHAITDRAAKAVFTEAEDEFLERIQRWIGHADIREVATWVCQLDERRPGGAPPHIAALLKPREGKRIDSDTVEIADGFLQLNERREEADYDHDGYFNRADTLSQIELAKAVVERVEGTQTAAAKLFFGLIAMRAKIQSR
jgi:hypothetical protein